MNKKKHFPVLKLSLTFFVGLLISTSLIAQDWLIVKAFQPGQTLHSIMFANDSAISQELQTSLRELADAARSLRILSDYLERHPEALLRGKERQ